MNFSLIICTYQRPKPLFDLLKSIELQTLYPNEILIIDGSTDNLTDRILVKNPIHNLIYHRVNQENRGLTKQRNFGINLVNKNCEIVCFLDDDTVLEINYFEKILETYYLFPDAMGVGGYINNEIVWQIVNGDYVVNKNKFVFDGFQRNESLRYVIRKKLGLDSNVNPGFAPDFSHGRSISFLPPSGNIYQVEQLMGGVSSFPKKVFENFRFSNYFEGYGLYEDADFTLRLSKIGKLYVNTAAKLSHFHNPSGRPNQFNYGKMVVRNGYYVWRVKTPDPTFETKIKWLKITLLLILIRLTNVFNTQKKLEALTESIGRIVSLFGLIFNKPIIENKN